MSWSYCSAIDEDGMHSAVIHQIGEIMVMQIEREKSSVE
jgi:hypothetical protein